MQANSELLVNNALRGDVILQHLRQTKIYFTDNEGDFFPDQKTCIFYLSLRSLAAKSQNLSSFIVNSEFERLKTERKKIQITLQLLQLRLQYQPILQMMDIHLQMYLQ